MMNHPNRGLIVLGLPVAAVALFAAVFVLRMQEPGRPAPHPRNEVQKQTSPAAKPESATASAASRSALAPAPRSVALAASEEASLRGTYQNYWTAVATQNQSLKQGLERVLLRNAPAAQRFAEEALAGARTPRDREIAQETLQALRRQP